MNFIICYLMKEVIRSRRLDVTKYMASIVFHGDLRYNWRWVSETFQRLLKSIKSLLD